jgi:hypothetical protein
MQSSESISTSNTPKGLDVIPSPADAPAFPSFNNTISNANGNGFVVPSFIPPPSRVAQYGVPQISHQQAMNAFSPAEAREIMAERMRGGEERSIQLAPSNTPTDVTFPYLPLPCS